jgi:hypothetical protein
LRKNELEHPRSGYSHRNKALAAEAVDRPEKQAKDNAEQDRGCKRKGDRPSATAPGEISRKTTKRQVEATQAKDYKPEDNQQQAKKEECATDVRHIWQA